MRAHDLDLKSWSFFEMTEEDVAALEALSSSSILCPEKDGTEPASAARQEIQGGQRRAISLRDTGSDDAYRGLCVFGAESPSPAGDRGIALHTLAADQWPPAAGRMRPTREAVTRMLLDDVRRFCVTHGYTRIQCYAPPDSDTLALLMRHGFEPEGVVVDGDSKAFSLSQHLAPAYTGDPYDGRDLLRWIARQLRLEVLSSDDTRCEARLRLSNLNPDLAETALAKSALPLCLELNAAPGGQNYLRIGVETGQSYVPAASLSLAQLRDLAGEKRIDMTLWPPPAVGASIAVEARSDLLGRFKPGRRNAFFDSGSFGTLLTHGIEHGVPPVIFFVDFATTATNPRLIGLGTVAEVHQGSPDDLWRRWGSLSIWTDGEEFARYAAIKKRMTVIVFDGLRPMDVVGPGLPLIGHSWTYVPAGQAYEVSRRL